MAYEYVANGKRIVLAVDEDLVAVRFKEPAPHSMRANIATKPELGTFSSRIEVAGEKFTIFPIAQTAQPRSKRFELASTAMDTEDDVARVTPVFKVGESHILATDRVSVGFKHETANVKKLLDEYNLDILEEYYKGEYLVQLSEAQDPFEIVEQLNALEEVEYAEPDFATIQKHLHRADSSLPEESDDPLVKHQYAVELTKADEAWKQQTGDPNIRIAILDEGVDINHEDLAGAIVGSYDATDNDEFQEPKRWDAHGTACAGLAAAIHNNQRGIQGIGGGCSLLALRIAFSDFDGGPWTTRVSWIVRAIDWAWTNGADVLSNSWGGGAPSSAITKALERARTQGRNGKGCVIVVAAGNSEGPVLFPANLNNMLTVSASNEYDEPKTKTSMDGEHWWGTNFGPEVDVAAPGVHNYTTDNSGTGGYNREIDGNYFSNFNGTSSSTPIVAGAVGLILSANKDLTEEKVRQIIRDTADKVGSIQYVNGRNDWMGNGRLNVIKAIQSAQ